MHFFAQEVTHAGSGTVLQGEVYVWRRDIGDFRSYHTSPGYGSPPGNRSEMAVLTISLLIPNQIGLDFGGVLLMHNIFFKKLRVAWCLIHLGNNHVVH